MDVVKYNFALSAHQPFVYSCQQYGACYTHPGSDMHDALHLLIMLNGSFEVEISGARALYSSGDIVLIAPWEVHGNYTMRDHARLLSITIEPELLRDGLSAIAPRLDALLLMPPQERMCHLKNCAAGLPAIEFASVNIDWGGLAFDTSAPVSEKRIGFNDDLTQSQHFVQILQLFCNILARSGALELSGEKHKLYLRLQPALKLLVSGRKRPLTTEQAAGECALSSSYFNVIFKKIYGISFYAYELKYRLRCAENELKSGNAAVKVLAQKWGFADAPHFSRTFKRFYGVSPADYRL